MNIYIIVVVITALKQHYQLIMYKSKSKSPFLTKIEPIDPTIMNRFFIDLTQMRDLSTLIVK